MTILTEIERLKQDHLALVPVVILTRIRPADDHYDKVAVIINALNPDRRLEQMPMLVDPLFEVERLSEHTKILTAKLVKRERYFDGIRR